MKFRDYLSSPLLEGGQAIKGSSKITQDEVKSCLPDLLAKIQEALKLNSAKVKVIGSAGKKPEPSDTSGDIDVAVECDEELVISALDNLAGSNSKREMKGIGVFSFGYDIGNKIIQVDLMPVENIKFAEWSFQANKEDLEQGLKGAHRNELFFAIAKNMPQEVIKEDSDGNPIIFKRFFYDLRRGLMEGLKTREGKKKLSKNFSTSEKKVLSSDPKKITEMMFGKGFTPEQTSTFDGCLAAIRDKKFQYHENVSKILELAKKGIKDKGLKIPKSL
jgi:translation initiation factor 2 beta subunit (eIF-2beta)/eIF-5